jgi:Tol biopolymer transport system component
VLTVANPTTTQNRLTTSANQDLHPAWSPDGSKIAFASNRMGGPNIWLMDAANGGNPTRLTTSTQPEDDPAWLPIIGSPLIAFDSKRVGASAQIYTMNPFATNPEGTLVPLTSSSGNNFEPTWSRDGLQIAFTSVRDGNQEIYTMNANGTNQQRRTTYSGVDRNPDW